MSTIPVAQAPQSPAELMAALGAYELDPHGFHVYCLWGEDGNAVYVGKSTNILARLGTHMGGTEKRELTYRISVLRCETERAMKLTEDWLIDRLQPPLNIAGKAERPRPQKTATAGRPPAALQEEPLPEPGPPPTEKPWEAKPEEWPPFDSPEWGTVTDAMFAELDRQALVVAHQRRAAGLPQWRPRPPVRQEGPPPQLRLKRRSRGRKLSGTTT